MRRRQRVADHELPMWWFVCVVEDWSDDGVDKLSAALNWYAARHRWAKEHGFTEMWDLPEPSDNVPRFRHELTQ